MIIEELEELERHLEELRVGTGPFRPAWHRRLAHLAEALAIEHRAAAEKKEAARTFLEGHGL